MNKSESFSDAFRLALDIRGLTQLKFSEMMGVFPSQVANWATGKQVPYKRNQYKIGELLNFTFKETHDGWELIESNYPETNKAESRVSEPTLNYTPLPSAAATLEDLEKMLEMVESTVRIARTAIIELKRRG